MRVLHLVKTAVGASWALRQMDVLCRLGTEVHAAMPDGPMVEKYRSAGVVVHELMTDFPLRQPWKLPALARRLRALVDETHPDIVHSHFVGTTLTMRAALRRSRSPARLFQVPGPLHLESPLFRWAELATSGPADSWVASCEWTRERYLRSGIAPERLFLSYYGVDLSSFRLGPKGRLRAELRLGDDVRVVGMVAYMYAPKRYLGQRRGLKGHEDLIDALALLRRERSDVVGVFVGDAWGGADAYAERVREYGRKRCGDAAIFLGTRTDVPLLYPDFDVVVHPSHSENVGGAAESLNLGIPTIATEVGGFPDLVRHGETGLLVPPHRPDEIAAAIEHVLDHPDRAAAMAAAGKELARELFDVERTGREVQRIYESITA